MKKLYYSFFVLLLIFNFFSIKAYSMKSLHGLDGREEYIIDASKNARLHSNMGNIYFEEGNYVAALAEYEIAYNLALTTSAASTYLYNIAKTNTMLGEYDCAKRALLAAINKDCINITYYKALVECFSNLNTLQKEFDNYIKNNSNPYNKIIAGLICLKLGNKNKARTILDDFTIENPDMIITTDVINILNNIK